MRLLVSLAVVALCLSTFLLRGSHDAALPTPELRIARPSPVSSAPTDERVAPPPLRGGIEREPVVSASGSSGRSLSGTVLDESGHPVPGARLLWIDTHGSAAARDAISDQEGAFTLPLPGDPAAAEGTLLTLAEGFVPERTPCTVRDGQRVVNLSRGWSLGGRVVDEDGVAVQGVTVGWRVDGGVLLDHEEHWIEQQTVPSGARGEFHVEGVLPGRVVVVAAAPGYCEGRLSLESGQDRATLEVTLPRGFQLAGRVLTRDGDTVAGARVELAPAEGGAGTQRQRTDGEGRFLFEGLTAGAYSVAAESEGLAPSGEVVAVPAPEPLCLRLDPCAMLRGAVRTASMRYWVELQDLERERRTTEMFETPEFRLSGLVPGDYLVTVRPRSGASEEVGVVTLRAGETTDLGQVDVGYSGTELSGQVTSSDGTLVRTRLVLFRHADLPGATGAEVAEAVTDTDGWFVFAGLVAGTYDLAVRPDAGADTEVSALVVDGVRPLDVGVIRVEASGSLEVRMLGMEGEPIGGKNLSVGVPGMGYSCRTDRDGVARRDGLPAGSCSAAILRNGIPYSVHGEIVPGQTTRLTIDLRDISTRTWEPRLVDARGRAVVGAYVGCVARNGHWRSGDGQTDAQGRVRLEGAFEGPALLEVTGAREVGGCVAIAVEFDARGRGPQEVRMPGGALAGSFPDGAVALRLVRLDWATEATEGVLQARGGRFATLTRPADGRYHVEMLPPTSYRLDWLGAGGAVVASEAVPNLAEGETRRL